MVLAVAESKTLHKLHPMKNEQRTPRLTMKLHRDRTAFQWFSCKTNRLALYSLRLYQLELNLYVARHWAYEIWEDETAPIEPPPIAIALSAAPAPSKILPFRPLPGRASPLLPPMHNNH